MKLKPGISYRVYIPDGTSYALSIIRLTVVSDEGEGWYKVQSAGEVFFLNLNLAIKVFEE